jgi:hypothetical protein
MKRTIISSSKGVALVGIHIPTTRWTAAEHLQNFLPTLSKDVQSAEQRAANSH